jgi:hypothetical protein
MLAIISNVNEISRSVEQERKIDADKLCLYMGYTPKINLFDTCIRFDDDALMQVLMAEVKTAGTFAIKKLRRLLGANLTTELAIAIIHGKATWSAVASIAIKRIAELPSSLELPVNIITISRDKGLTGRYPRTPLTDAQWYGKALKATA